MAVNTTKALLANTLYLSLSRIHTHIHTHHSLSVVFFCFAFLFLIGFLVGFFTWSNNIAAGISDQLLLLFLVYDELKGQVQG